MTDVVTNAAVSLQPYLQAHRQQAFGSDQPDPVASDQAASSAAISDDVATEAAQVPQPGGDRSALQDSSEGGGNATSWLPTSTGSGGSDAGQALVPTTGPAKAVIVAPPINDAILGPPEDLDIPDLEQLEETVIGTAFAPLAVNLVGSGPRTTGQKDIIFDNHKVFGGQVPQQSSVATPGAGVAVAANDSFAAAAQAAQQAFAPATGASFQSSESFYQRVQAIAQALGAKAPANPGVKQLFSDLAAIDTPTEPPTVSVTA